VLDDSDSDSTVLGMANRRVGVLTAGGDCPGLNAVLRSFVHCAIRSGRDVIGFENAWQGVANLDTVQLDIPSVRGILHKGGTILGTRRGGPFDTTDGVAAVEHALGALCLDGIVTIGGNGTLTVASRLFSEHGIPIIGIPKTIDNDVWGTHASFGFHTAVQIATDAIDRLHTTSESHDRIILVEVMGRDAGWIAAHAAIAGGACAVLLPEREMSVDELSARVLEHHGVSRSSSIVVVAEGAALMAGERALEELSAGLTLRTGYEVRTVALGHIQRGGTPTAYDRVLASSYGAAAVRAVRDDAWGQYVVFDGVTMGRAPLAEAAGRTRLLDDETLDDVFSSLL
jgi:6-phosphofructokinase